MTLGSNPFTTARALEEIPEWHLYGPDYERVIHGVHMVGGDLPDHGHRLEGTRLRAGDEAVLVGVSAAWALGCQLARGTDRVHAAGANPRRTQDLIVHRLDIDDSEVVPTPWGPATNPARTMADLARGMGVPGLSIDQRVGWVDAVAHRTRTPVQEARDLVRSWPRGRKGTPEARTVLHLARDGAESLKETELRLLVRRHGLPEPVLQHEVWTSASSAKAFVARLDLSWPWARVGLEYDGAHHRERRHHSKDLGRHNELRVEGWLVLQVDADSLRAPSRWLAHLLHLLA